MNKITIKKDIIDYAISNMQNAINKKNIIDITSNISIETIEEKLVLKATDHEIYIKKSIKPTSIEGTIKCAINGELISNIMKALNDDDEVLIEQTEEVLIVKQNKTLIFKIPIFEINDFPFSQDFKDMEEINVNKDFLLQSIKQVMHCCNEKENLNIAMQGILFEIKNQKISIVATDSKRLGCVQKEDKHGIKSFTSIIPKKTINEIIKLFDENFSIYVKRMDNDDKLETIGFINEQTEFYAKLINANYPDFETILLNKPKTESIKIKKELILKAINQINAICYKIKLTMSKNEIILETIDGINGSSASIKIDNIVNNIEDSLSIGLTNKHIIDCISNTKYEEIELLIDNPNKPIFIITKDYEEIIMPQIL